MRTSCLGIFPTLQLCDLTPTTNTTKNPPSLAFTLIEYIRVPRVSGHLKLSQVTETSGGRICPFPYALPELDSVTG